MTTPRTGKPIGRPRGHKSPAVWTEAAVDHLCERYEDDIPVLQIIGELFFLYGLTVTRRQFETCLRKQGVIRGTVAAGVGDPYERKQLASMARAEAARGRTGVERVRRPADTHRTQEAAQRLVWTVPEPGRDVVLRQRAENGRGRV